MDLHKPARPAVTKVSALRAPTPTTGVSFLIRKGSPANRRTSRDKRALNTGRLKENFRLRDGTSVEAAQGELESIAERLAELYPKDNRDWSVLVRPFAQDLVRDVRQAL